MAGKKKDGVAVIIADSLPPPSGKKGKGGDDDKGSDKASGGELVEVMDELLGAIDDKDAKAMARIFRSAMKMG